MYTLMKNTKTQNKRTFHKIARKSLLLTAAVLLLSGFGTAHIVRANLQEQINELAEENNDKKQEKHELEIEATDLNDKMNKLQAQIDSLQAQIKANQKHSEELQAQITKAEDDLAKQKALLGENIKQMYLEDEISTLEMLATSRDLSDFVDKQQYRSAIKDKIKSTVDTITELKLKLKQQKEEVELLLQEQQENKADLATQRAEQKRLLELNAGERSDLDHEIKENAKEIQELKRQQAIENARLFGGTGGVLGGGGYPWGSAKCIHTGQVEGPCWNYDWSMNGSIYNWSTNGYGYRNCTDWVAYRARVSGAYVPSGMGNAKQWDDRAPGYGFTVSGTPREGAAAVSNGGYYGHVMFVEVVNGDGTIIVSDYNRAGTGKYDMTTLSAATASNLSYVYFK